VNYAAERAGRRLAVLTRLLEVGQPVCRGLGASQRRAERAGRRPEVLTRLLEVGQPVQTFTFRHHLGDCSSSWRRSSGRVARTEKRYACGDPAACPVSFLLQSLQPGMSVRQLLHLLLQDVSQGTRLRLLDHLLE
jgi:hypothetical protein